MDVNTISFEGIGAQYATFASALTSENIGAPVKISASKTVTACADGDIMNGKASVVEMEL